MTDDLLILYDFAAPTQVEGWSAIDDRVMGGVSRSDLVASASGTALFRGTLSRDSGGGFASVRSSPELRALGAWTGIALRFRGDGRAYALRIRTDADFDGATHQATLATVKGAWDTLRIPFHAFQATYRGRALPDAGALDPSRIMTFGLLVAGERIGSFELELAWIAAYRS